MKPKDLLLLVILLPLLVLALFAVNNFAKVDDSETNNLRSLLGFSSIAIGNLNPAARQPGVEVFCTSIYDVPAGYCIYFTNGVYSDFEQYVANVSLGGD